MATTDQAFAGDATAKAVTTLLDGAARSRLASLAIIAIVALASFLPGLGTLPPLDGFETGTAVAAREMVATGDYAVVRLQTADRTWSPRGMYWLEAISVALAGQGLDPPIWVYRGPSLIAAIAAALLTWWVAMAFGRPRAALLAGLFMAASGLVGLNARLASADSVLLVTTILAAGILARLWLGREDRPDWRLVVPLWTAVGVGVLLKGVVAPAMLAATFFVLSVERGSFGWLQRFRPRAGLAWLLALSSPWLIAVLITYVSGAASEAPGEEFLRRIGAPFTIVAPAGTYVLFAGLAAGPALALGSLAMGWIVDNLRRPAVFFALAWGGPLWLAAELIEAKLPQHILPAMPAIALLAGVAIDAGAVRIAGRLGRVLSLAPLTWRVATVAVVPLAFVYWQGRFPVVAFGAFVVGAAAAAIGWTWLRRGHAGAAAVLWVAGAVVIHAGFFGLFVPGLDGLRIGERVAAIAAAAVPCSHPAVAVAGYPEESVVLAAGRQARLLDAAGAADFLDGGGCRAAAINGHHISSFRQRADDLGLDVVDRGQVRGFNLRKVRRADIHVFTPEGAVE